MNMAEQQLLAHKELRGKLQTHISMARHTSWRVGGLADRFYAPADIEDLAQFLRSLPSDEAIYFIGLGSNTLVRDGGVRGTVILTHPALSALRLENETQSESGELALTVYCEAGVASPKLARFTARHGLCGAEFLVGIPGTLGGALAMNTGCFGHETWGMVHRVLVVGRDGKVMQRNREDYEVGYRSVTLKGNQNTPALTEWFLAAWIRLDRGDAKRGKQTIDVLLKQRGETQPLDRPNAGSVFRNPKSDFAARLIEQCGFKGLRVGGAEISQKHANFIVNTGTAMAADIEALIQQVQQGVKDLCGVDLEAEVRIIGEP